MKTNTNTAEKIPETEVLAVSTEIVSSPAPSTGVDRDFLLSVLICSGLLFLRYLIGYDPKSVLFTNDMAISFAVAKLNLLGEYSLLGPPSHLGGRHLGPIFYWYVSFGLMLARYSVDAAMSLFLVFKLSALCSLYFSLPRLLPRRSVGIALLGFTLCVCSGMYEWILDVPWHNHFLVIPSIVFAWMVYATVIHFERRFLPTLIVASLLLQGHLSTAPLIFAGGIIICARAIQKKPDWVRALNHPFWILGLGLSWIHLLAYEFLYSSNFQKLAHVHFKPTQQTAGLKSAHETTMEFFRQFLFRGHSISELCAPLPTALGLTIAFGFGAIALHGMWRAQDAKIRNTLRALALITLVFGIFLARLRPPIFPYYLYPMLMVVPIFVAIASGYALEIVRQSTTNIIFKATACVATLGFLLLLLRASYLNILEPHQMFSIPQESLRHAQEVAALMTENKETSDLAKLKIIGPGEKDLTWERENAVYYLLGQDYFHLMKGAKVFEELPSFNRRTNPDPNILFVEQCTKDAEALNSTTRENAVRSDSSGPWTSPTEILPAQCTTCDGCRFWRYSK